MHGYAVVTKNITWTLEQHKIEIEMLLYDAQKLFVKTSPKLYILLFNIVIK